MRCQFCNAIMKPQVSASGIKWCPKCKLIVGSKRKHISDEQYLLHFTDRPKEVKGKYQPHLVLGSLTRAIARVREYGVRKYHGEDGWKQQTAKDYMDAIGRHYDECRNDPESRDMESGLLHIAQIATNAMFVIQMLKEQGIDLDVMKDPPNAK